MEYDLQIPNHELQFPRSRIQNPKFPNPKFQGHELTFLDSTIINSDILNSKVLNSRILNPNILNYEFSILNAGIIDEIIQVQDDEALATARLLAKHEGIPAGISSGATVWAALQIAARPENAGKMIVVIVASSAERYLSTALVEDV